MQIRGRGNAVAVALAGLAVVIAATGTAVAVTATTVTVVDPTAPSHAAHVDSSGRLNTVGATSTLTASALVTTPGTGLWNYVSSPTTASLALSELDAANENAAPGDANDRYVLYLAKVGVNATNQCDSTVSALVLRRWTVAPGQDIVDDLSAPLLVKATGSAKYCLAVFGATQTGSPDDGTYFATFTWTGYVAGGSYSGLGGGAPVTRPLISPRKTRR